MNLSNYAVEELKKSEVKEIEGGGVIDWFARKVHVWQNVWTFNKHVIDHYNGSIIDQINRPRYS